MSVIMIKPFKKMTRGLDSAGDTIVEVLIVLAVLGMAFSISYATANRGLQESRNAQEHSQALGIINSQVELLRAAFAKQAGGTLPVSPGPFCLSSPTSTNPANFTPLGGGFNDTLADDSLDTTTYPGPCTQNALYSVSIVNKTPASTDGGLYDFRVRWFGVGTLGRQQEELTYRIGSIAFSGVGGGGGGVVGGGGYIDHETPPPPPLSGALSVTVKAIPAAAGNNTPSCTAAASQSLSGTNVRLTDNSTGGLVGTKNTNASSMASFTGIQQGDSFAATITRSGWQVCSSDSPKIAGVPPPTPNISVTIRPVCQTYPVYTYGWVWGARRTDLDNYYGTIPPVAPSGYYSAPYGTMYMGNVNAPGNFVYVWAGINNSNDSYEQGQGYLYYYIWEASWQVVSTTYTNYCPS